jgi:transposase
MKIEVLGTERRRRWNLQGKLQIVEETLQPGVTVTEVARRHGLAPSVVFTWRRLAREGRLGDADPAFMPVEITPVPGQTTPVASPPPRRTGVIEIFLKHGQGVINAGSPRPHPHPPNIGHRSPYSSAGCSPVTVSCLHRDESRYAGVQFQLISWGISIGLLSMDRDTPSYILVKCCKIPKLYKLSLTKPLVGGSSPPGIANLSGPPERPWLPPGYRYARSSQDCLHKSRVDRRACGYQKPRAQICILLQRNSGQMAEMMQERGIKVDPSTLFRWVQRYAPEIEKRMRRYQGPVRDRGV